MKNKNQLEEYSFPDCVPDQQLIAMSKVISQLTLCLNREEKSFENTDYTKINHGYAGDLYANDLCELGFLDVAVSYSARNYALHNGFEAKTEERNKINSKIKLNNGSNYFFWATTDGKPWMLSMEKEFITECFTFCRLTKEGFDKEKGIFEL